MFLHTLYVCVEQNVNPIKGVLFIAVVLLRMVPLYIVTLLLIALPLSKIVWLCYVCIALPFRQRQRGYDFVVRKSTLLV